MEFLLTFLLVTFVLGAMGVVITRRAVHSVQRRALQLRSSAALTARSYTVGPSGEVARLRRDLYRSIVSLRRALAVARAAGGPLGDVPSLLVRLDMAAESVDAELRLLETVQGRGNMASRLDGPRARARELIAAAGDLTTGLLDAAGHHAVDVSLLSAECAVERQALRAAVPASLPASVRRARLSRP